MCFGKGISEGFLHPSNRETASQRKCVAKEASFGRSFKIVDKCFAFFPRSPRLRRFSVKCKFRKRSYCARCAPTIAPKKCPGLDPVFNLSQAHQLTSGGKRDLAAIRPTRVLLEPVSPASNQLTRYTFTAVSAEDCSMVGRYPLLPPMEL